MMRDCKGETVKTMMMIAAMASAVLAQGAPQEAEKAEKLRMVEEKLKIAQAMGGGGTLLDMIDGTGGGWFYSASHATPLDNIKEMTLKLDGAGHATIEGGKEPRAHKAEGGHMAMPRNPRSGGGTLLDLVDLKH